MTEKTPIISLTEKANDHLKSKIADNKGMGFRLSVKKTGCSGYAYVPEIINTKKVKRREN